MFEIRVHGRDGQGVVAVAELLSSAYFDEGGYAQAFPCFGSERSGAPVVSFCRFDDKPIRIREPIARPDALIIIDPALIRQVDVFGGLREGGYVLINSARSLDEMRLGEFAERFGEDRCVTVPATEIARELLGRPLPNAAILGGFAALTETVSLSSVTTAIEERFSGNAGARNAAGARRAFELVSETREPAYV